MKDKRLGLFCTGIASIAVFAASANAQRDASNERLIPESQVVDVQEYDLGGRSVIYRQVTPPELKESPEPSPETIAPIAPRQANEMELRRAQKAYFTPFIDAVYVDNGLSVIRWRDDSGDYVVWSTMDSRASGGAQ